ncbi:GntR family transcriptional regulator [Pseudonocardia sp.]|jgi:GntR family transcriptional regulator|uniref:GntR family transcriptional regulator n=1 Tax=Pseudonocardia sp. TaxID=60912 RepID=UPI002F402B4C
MNATSTATVISASHRGNNGYLPSPSVAISIRQREPMPERGLPGRPSPRDHEVRRLHDLIRAAVLGGGYSGGQLPSETELMASHSATRATVRTALTMLRAERLIERTQGVGTHAVVAPRRTQLEEALGVLRTPDSHLFDPATRPMVLDRSTIPAPPTLADWLRVPPGTPCLRLEYLACFDEEPISVATNYVLYPEAEQLLRTPFRTDWYTLLQDAGVVLGESEFVLDSVLADPTSAALLGIGEGTPLLAMDQTIRDRAGRVFNVAFIRLRTNRFRFVSRASAPT